MALQSDIDRALRRFGHDRFRPGQREAIETLLEMGRLLLVAPTGGGKSLIYQLPASLLPGTTLVVSPLIALMHDQVRAMDAVGVPATFLASTIDAAEAGRRLRSIARGEYKLVYVAPERLALPGFQRLLGEMQCPLIAIDEAHCISEWGHDFRPEYLGIGRVLEQVPEARVLACTATATPLVRDEILVRLGLPPDTPQAVHGFARPNLVLRAREPDSAKQRQAEIDAALAEALGGPRQALGAAIIYAPTRRASETEADRLAKRGWRADAYHAGLGGARRTLVQTHFLDGSLDVVVATNAFGMGIDRADVRLVAHLGPPGSLEAYYQEVGRAGRDGERAYGRLLVSPDDLPRRRGLLERGGDEGPPAPEVLEHKWGLFLELLSWAQGGSCRHDAILRYFGDEAETLSGCGHCDVCERLDEPDAEDEATRTEIVRKALSAVARVHGRFGLRAAVNLLRGVADDRLARSGLDSTRTFGALKERGDAWLMRLLQRCVSCGWVSFTGSERPLALLTPEGREVMRGERPARVLLPPERSVRAPASAGGGGRRGRAVRPPDDEAAFTGVQQTRFDALRAWRQTRASEGGLPAYVIAHDRTLRDLARLVPGTREDLALAWGMGPQKIARYGGQILEVLGSVPEVAG